MGASALPFERIYRWPHLCVDYRRFGTTLRLPDATYHHYHVEEVPVLSGARTSHSDPGRPPEVVDNHTGASVASDLQRQRITAGRVQRFWRDSWWPNSKFEWAENRGGTYVLFDHELSVFRSGVKLPTSKFVDHKHRPVADPVPPPSPPEARRVAIHVVRKFGWTTPGTPACAVPLRDDLPRVSSLQHHVHPARLDHGPVHRGLAPPSTAPHL